MIRQKLVRSALTCAALLWALAIGSSALADAADYIDPAIAAYREAMESSERDARLQHFRRAGRLFDAAIDESGGSAELYTNLGNASLQAERLGSAVLAYRRALLLDPSQERARQNLQHARGLLPEWVPTPPEAGAFDSFFLWHQSVARADRQDLAALAFAVAFVSLAASIAFGRVAPRYAAGLAGAVWLALLASLAFDPARLSDREGVVVAREVVARAADSINAPSRFGEPVPSGTELRILEDRGGWLQVELYNGRNAWVASSAVERVGVGSHGDG